MPRDGRLSPTENAEAELQLANTALESETETEYYATKAIVHALSAVTYALFAIRQELLNKK